MVRHDDVVLQPHADGVQGRPDPGGDGVVVLGGQGDAAGVVVGQDDGAGRVEDGVLHHLADVHRHGGDAALSQAAAGQALQWAVIALAWVNILCDGELWITLSAVGIFVGKVVLEAALTGYYGSRM